MRWFESSHPSKSVVPRAGVRSGEARLTLIPPYLQRALDAFTAHDLARASECFAVDAVYLELRREPVRGRAAIAEHFAHFTASAVAWQFVVDDVIVAAHRACVVYRFFLAEGTGRPGRERGGCAIVHLDTRGQIAQWREYEG